MKLTDTLSLILLAAIWGSSFIFTRAIADVFGPIALITVRIVVAAACLIVFLLPERRRIEFLQHWKTLAIIGVINSAIPFILLAYASLFLTGGTVSILNAMTPIFTAFIAHLWLHDKMTAQQFAGLAISICGLFILVWDKVSFNMQSWLPILAGVLATVFYGLSSNSTKKYLTGVSTMTASSGSMLFAALFMLVLSPFFLPDISKITALDWLYAVVLGVVCTAIAYVMLFRLIRTIGPSRTVTVTFLIPIFAFLWGFLFLGEVVTMRMIGATVIILSGMSLVLRLVDLERKAPAG